MTAQDLLNAFRRVEYRHYMREYMLIRRAKQREHKICPDCGVRHVDYRCIYCSECAEIRRQMSNDIYDHNRRMKIKGATA